MNPMALFADIARTLWTVSLQAVVPAADLAVRGMSARLRYWLWFVVLARLCIPMAVPLPAQVHSYLTGWMAHTPATEEPAPPPMEPLANFSGPQTFAPIPDLPSSASSAGEPVDRPFAFKEIPVGPVAGMLWLAGVAAFLLVIAGRTRRMIGIVRASEPITRADITELAAKLAADMGLRHPAALLAADDHLIATPAAVGVFRPRILIPRSMAETWTPEELTPVLLHEMAHIRRRDLWMNWLQIALQTVWFFNPVVWYANHRLRRCREELCDDLAVSRAGMSPAAYSRSILKVLEHIAAEPSFGLVGLCIAERKSGAERRIRRLLASGYHGALRLGVKGVIGLGLVALVGIILSCTTEKPREGRPRFEESVFLANAWGAQLKPPENLRRSLLNLSDAVNEYTNIETKVDRHLYLDDKRIFDIPFVYITADSKFDLTTIETVSLGNYLRNGGFAFVENGSPDLEYGDAEHSLRRMLSLALYDDGKFIPIPYDHPIYHCFFDFDDGPPQGSAPIIAPPDSLSERKKREWSRRMPYLEGIWIDQRLVAIYSDFGYGAEWVQDENNEQQIKMGVNLVVYALTQEGNIGKERFGYIFSDLVSPENKSATVISPLTIEVITSRRPGEAPVEGERTDQPGYSGDTLARARAAYHDERFDEAITLFRQFIDEHPEWVDSVDILIQLGTALYDNGEPEEAITVLDKLIDRNGNEETPRYVKALALIELGRREEALADLQLIVRRYSDATYLAPDAMYWIGEIYLREGRPSEALDQYEALVERYPDAKFIVPDAEKRIGEIREMLGRPEDPDSGNSPSDEGNTTPGGEQQEYNQGLEEYNRARLIKAVETIETFIETYPDSRLLPDALFHLGDSLFNLGELSRAVTVFSRLINEYPRNPRLPEAMYLSVMARKAMNEYGPAMAMAQRIIDEFPASPQAPDAAYQLGEMYYRQGKYAEALEMLRLVVENYPDDREAVVAATPLIEDAERRVNYPTPSNRRTREPWENTKVASSPTYDPRVVMGGMQELFEPAGCPLSETQISYIENNLHDATGMKVLYGMLTTRQKRVIVENLQASLAKVGESLSEEQVQLIMTFGPESTAPVDSLFPPDKEESLLRGNLLNFYGQ